MGGRTSGRIPLPRWGTLGTLATVVFMVAVSIHLYPGLPARVDSAEYDILRGSSDLPGWAVASILPAVSLTMVAVFSLVSVVGDRFHRALETPTPWSTRSLRRVVDLFSLLLALLLAALHVVTLYEVAGGGPSLPTDRIVALTLAAFLVGMGAIAPILRAERPEETPAARWWEQARGWVGASIALVGVATGVMGLVLPDPTVAAYTVMLMGPAILVGCAVPFVGDREWKKEPRSGP